MNTSIVSKQLELTDAIKQYVQERIAAFEKFNLDIIAVRAVLTTGDKNGKKGYGVEFVIQLAGKDTVVIKQTDKDLYAAADLALERAKKVLGRHHDKSTNYKTGLKMEIPNVALDETQEEDEIVPAEMDIHKPFEIDDALERFKLSGSMFMVFNDTANKMRVMYRRKDGKVGLY